MDGVIGIVFVFLNVVLKVNLDEFVSDVILFGVIVLESLVLVDFDVGIC